MCVSVCLFEDIRVHEGGKQFLSLPTNGAVSLTCPVIGFPTPVYTWEDGGKKVEETNRTRNIFSNGSYTCYGSNMAGKIPFRFTVGKLLLAFSLLKSDSCQNSQGKTINPAIYSIN